MKLSEVAEKYIDEIEGAEEYKELMEKNPEKANIFQKIHNEEVQHAKILLGEYPFIKEELKEYHLELKEKLEEIEEIITMM